MTSSLDRRTRDRLALYRRMRDDPAWFAKHILGVDLWQKQLDILHSVRDNRETAVASCHGAGKSFTAAIAVLWFLLSHPRSVVVTTAPTFRQVRNIIWQEIATAYNRAAIPLGGKLNQADLHLSEGWFAFGITPKNSDAFQGLHADHIFVVADEGAGIAPGIWLGIEGVMTSDHARLLVIGNPTESSGPFYDMFSTPGISTIHISAFDTPNLTEGKVVIPGLVSPEWVEDKKKRWGENSPMYQARVLGRFPTAGANTLIPLTWIEDAVERGKQRVADGIPEDGGNPKATRQLGVDVARYGDDETVIYLRNGTLAKLVIATQKQSTMETAGLVKAVSADFDPHSIGVDSVGVGAGVFDRLQEQHLPVVEMSGGNKARDPERFVNARAEWFWALRERFEEGDIDLHPDDEVIVGQLAAIRYFLDSRGRIGIETKDDMVKRGLPSPDHADALAYAFSSGAVASQPVLTPSPPGAATLVGDAPIDAVGF